MQSRLSLAQYPAAGPFLRAYADPAQWSDGPQARWFAYSPHDPAAAAARITELRARPTDPQHGSRMAVVAAQQEAWGGGAAAREAARMLAEPDTHAVVTGQQVGLFGGPLFSQLKALTAVLLARKLAGEHPGCRFVPVFWLATGDSDFDEVRAVTVLGRDGEPRRIELPRDGTQWEGVPVGRRDVREHVSAALTELDAALGVGPHRDDTLAALREAYADGNLAHGFARWMARLFRDTPLVIVDPQDAALKGALAPLARRELTDPVAVEDALRARDAELAAAGFEPQVAVPPGDTNWFLLPDGRREKIVRDGDDFMLRPGGRRYRRAELLELAERDPAAFIPSALLGPLYQDALLPTVWFVGGGAELAYRAQSGAPAAMHGRRLAPALLRVSATLVPQKVAAALDDLGWAPHELYVPEQEVGSRVAQGELPADIRAALQDYLDALHTADRRLHELAVALDPALETGFDTLRGNLIRHVEKLEKKIAQSLKQRAEAAVRRARQAHALVYPRHAVQERELSLLSFLPRYGFELIGTLLERLEVPCWDHQYVEL